MFVHRLTWILLHKTNKEFFLQYLHNYTGDGMDEYCRERMKYHLWFEETKLIDFAEMNKWDQIGFLLDILPNSNTMLQQVIIICIRENR